jgi:hypothetical protein
VLLLGGVGSLINISGSRSAMRAFGVKGCLAGPAAALLAMAEVCGALLVLPMTGWWSPMAVAGVVAGTGLCAVFAVVGFQIRERAAESRQVTRSVRRLAA